MSAKVQCTFRLTRQELTFLKNLATAERLSIGNYILWKLVDAAKGSRAPAHGENFFEMRRQADRQPPNIPGTPKKRTFIDKLTGQPVPPEWQHEDGVPIKPLAMSEEEYEQRYGIKWR